MVGDVVIITTKYKQMKNREPWSFCKTPKEKCTMNYCDENGCQNRKRNYVEDNDLITDDSKPLTEMEYLEYMSKKAKTVNTIVYPDGSKGELNRGVIVLL